MAALLTAVEALSSGRPMADLMDVDVPLKARATGPGPSPDVTSQPASESAENSSSAALNLDMIDPMRRVLPDGRKVVKASEAENSGGAVAVGSHPRQHQFGP